MLTENKSARLAVLIDADNASAKIAEGLFEEIAKLGEASVRRIYGDFSSPHSKAWTDKLTQYAIIPMQQFAYTTGKNASDITLVIEAMDLLHSGLFQGFCLVSSDSDFTRLAQRIREEGVDVFGFGEQKTPESFRQACKRFVYTENFVPQAHAAHTVPAAAPRPPLMPVATHLKKIVSETESEDGWVALSYAGSQLSKLMPDFDPRTYGHKKLGDVVRHIDGIEVETASGGHLRLRLKPATKAASKAPPRPATKPENKTER